MVLGENGIVTKAKDARDQTKQAQANELQDFNNISGEIDEILSDNGSGNGGGSGSDTKVPAEPTEETAPYYPDGDFTKKEGTIDTGLVIADKAGNEYVWVVVPRTADVYKTAGVGKTTFTDDDYTNIETDLKNYTSAYVTTSGFSDTWYADTSNENWLTATEYKTLKNDMLKSVYLNGGFYVGRYEAGIETTGTNRTSIESKVNGKYPVPTTKPVTKADAYPYTYVTRTQAQNLAKGLSEEKTTYKSSLMFGVQWDLVLAFMSKDTEKIKDGYLTSNSTKIGNYMDSEFQLSETGKYAVYSKYSLSSTWKPATTATASFVDSSRNKIAQSSDGNGILVTTGTSEQNKVMNIYDIAGNVMEWTLEKTSSTDLPCADGGDFCYDTGSGSPAAYRLSLSTVSSGVIGFRVSLF